MLNKILTPIHEIIKSASRILVPAIIFAFIILAVRSLGPQLCIGKMCVCYERGSGKAMRTTCGSIIVFHGNTWQDTLMIWRHHIKPLAPK